MHNNFKMSPQTYLNKIKLPEILSPAGSIDSFKAAIQAGADAVYTGLPKYNARISADNFTFETLAECISYAHIRGVKVYITLNTLVSDSEIDDAVTMALEADRLGVDAFIIQDIGVAQKLVGKIKAQLHASTQMTVYNNDGLKVLHDMGFTRAVLARELSLKEISEICDAHIMETEVFCHGALCISYSGQCMMSRFLTGRSGNRGTCSQPCRLNYKLNVPDSFDNSDKKNNKFYNASQIFSPRMSPADLCSLTYLEELIKTGVDSLKIEGRLKSPEYTAIVTEKYKNAVISIGNGTSAHAEIFTEKDIEELSVIFSRGGFTSGHQLSKMTLDSITANKPGHQGLLAGKLLSPIQKVKGPVSIYKAEVSLFTDCLSQGDGITFEGAGDFGGVVNVITQKGNKKELTIAGKPPVFREGLKFYKNYDADLMKKYSKYYAPNTELRKVSVSAEIYLFSGKNCILTLSDCDGNKVTAESNLLCDFSEKGIAADDITKKLSELGGTPYKMVSVNVLTDGKSFVPFSVIKELRRKAVQSLSDIRKERR
ncbi:MAG: U32 family peptidase [Clostridia bacterium]|nr:U32 family peptidase [Clostridia bacterium]